MTLTKAGKSDRRSGPKLGLKIPRRLKVALNHCDCGNPKGLNAVAQHEDNGEYQELAVMVYLRHGLVADILIGLDGVTGDLRVLVSTDENPDEHTVAIYPLREKSKAVDTLWG
jgi:hypothetical protein